MTLFIRTLCRHHWPTNSGLRPGPCGLCRCWRHSINQKVNKSSIQVDTGRLYCTRKVRCSGNQQMANTATTTITMRVTRRLDNIDWRRVAVTVDAHGDVLPSVSCWRLNTAYKLIHTATPDTTKLSCLLRVPFGGVNWIPDNSWLSPTETLKYEHVQSYRPVHTATPDMTQTGPSCCFWCGGVNWVGQASQQVSSASECVGGGGASTTGATAGRTATQNAPVRRSDRLNSHHLTRHREHCLVVSGGRCELGIKLEKKLPSIEVRRQTDYTAILTLTFDLD